MMEEKERDYVILRTYRSVWKIDRKIYSIENIKLLFPVNPDELLYFIISVGIIFGLVKIFPFLNKIPFVLKGAGAYGLMKFLTRQKLDGKLPHKFFWDYLSYLISPKKIAKFKPVRDYGKVRFATPVVMRDIEIINKTELALKKDKDKGWIRKREKERKNNSRKRKKEFQSGKKMRKEA